MKRKILFFAVVCTTALFLAACGGNMQSVSSSPSAAQAEEEKTIYFKTDKGLNRFFSEYASIAEYPFEPDDIKQGNVRTKALVSTSDLYIELVNSKNELTICIDDGKEMSDTLCPVFRDFLRVLDGSLSDEQIEQAWADIKEIGTKHHNDGAYTLGNLKLTYSDVEFQGARQVKVNIYAPEYTE